MADTPHPTHLTPGIRAGVYTAVEEAMGPEIATLVASQLDGGSPVARAVSQLETSLLASLRELRDTMSADQQSIRKDQRVALIVVVSVVVLAMGVNAAMVGVGISYGMGGTRVETTPRGMVLPAPGVPLELATPLPDHDSDAWEASDDGGALIRDTTLPEPWGTTPEVD